MPSNICNYNLLHYIPPRSILSLFDTAAQLAGAQTERAPEKAAGGAQGVPAASHQLPQ